MNKCNIFSILVLWIGLLMTACTPPRPVSYAAPAFQANESETITQSLFQSKDRTLTEEAIQTLLDGKIVLPKEIRIALLNYSSSRQSRYYNSYWNNEEYLKLQQSYIDKISTNLGTSDRVSKLMLMPRLLANQQSNIVQLREATVRLQADMLLIFSIQSDLYYKYKVFKKDQAKAFATVEVLLMDIRTGMVPYSNVLTREKLILKEKEDFNLEEMRKRAEQEAILMALDDISKGVVEYFNES